MSLKDLQTKVGTTADGSFGPGTIKAAMEFFKLSPERAAHFFGQCAHETGEFKLFLENLNYSADGLRKIFGKYFPTTASTTGYARNPEKIANKVYSSRMGNGNEASGDGWKFRGRGALQTTGKSNYQALSTHLGKPEIMDNPDSVATLYAFEAALFYFSKNNLWRYCDIVNDKNITLVSKAINIGNALSKAIPHGLDDRIAKTKKYYEYAKRK
jgi:putative chitinase